MLKSHAWTRLAFFLLCTLCAFVLLGASAAYAQTNSGSGGNCAIQVEVTSGGAIVGEGTYVEGSSVTLKAEAVQGYLFNGWFENGERVYSFPVYTFIAASDRMLEARFSQSADMASASASSPAVAQESSQSSTPLKPEEDQELHEDGDALQTKDETSTAEDAVTAVESGENAQMLPETEEGMEENTKSEVRLPQTGKGVQFYGLAGFALLLLGGLFGHGKHR